MEKHTTGHTQPDLIIIYGVPGSGKSYLTSKLKDHFSSKNVKIIDPDLIESELKKNTPNTFDHEIWLKSREEAHSKLLLALKDSHTEIIIFEDTLQKKGYRRKLRSLARSTMLRYCEVWCNGPKEQLWDGNLAR